MPPKKGKKAKIMTSAKAEASAVKTIVNVRVGDQSTRRKTVKRGRRAARVDAGSSSALGIFNRPLPLATQNLTTVSQPPSMVNEYNELLRTLAMERRERMAAAAPLAPNTAPLTTNEQRNELLSIPDKRTPLTPIAQAYAVAAEATVEKELYDDPMTNETMFSNSGRLGELIMPRLPVSKFDFNDMIAYAGREDREQENLQDDVEEEIKTRAPPSVQRKYEGVSNAYAQYVEYLQNANLRYGINEPVKARRTFGSQKRVMDEIRRIQNIVAEATPKKAGRG